MMVRGQVGRKGGSETTGGCLVSKIRAKLMSYCRLLMELLSDMEPVELLQQTGDVVGGGGPEF